jgi:hypothetical protein
VTIIRVRREQTVGEHVDGAAGRTVGRRGVLGGLAALPVLYGIGSATPAQAATAAQPGGVSKVASTGISALARATGDLARGEERRYNAPLLTPGARLVLPTGIRTVAIQDYYHRPHLASRESAWPHMTAADGTTVDASVVPEHGAPTRIAILSGFRAGQGWYELILADKGTPRRVTWDAAKFPFLFLHGEFGATAEAPFNRFYTLALQPYSGNPYSRNGLTH